MSVRLPVTVPMLRPPSLLQRTSSWVFLYFLIPDVLFLQCFAFSGHKYSSVILCAFLFVPSSTSVFLSVCLPASQSVHLAAYLFACMYVCFTSGLTSVSVSIYLYLASRQSAFHPMTGFIAKGFSKKLCKCKYATTRTSNAWPMGGPCQPLA